MLGIKKKVFATLYNYLSSLFHYLYFANNNSCFDTNRFETDFFDLGKKCMIMNYRTSAELFAAKTLARQMRKELTENILPYWLEKIYTPSGAFIGRISGNDEIDYQAPIGAIMTSRILWTFASAYRVLKEDNLLKNGAVQEYLDMALRAKRLIIGRFYDAEYGGIYWSLRPNLSPLDTKKQIYAIAFAIYGMAELYRAYGDKEALNFAIDLFSSIEEHSFDKEKDGYFEAFTREWKNIEDMRLSAKDANESKTMNTHLHILEAYTCLYRVWKNPLLKKRLRGLILIFEDYIVGKDGHLKLFFNDNWACNYNIISYGHDIEASWLLHEAAMVLGDKKVLTRIEKLIPLIVDAASEGFSEKGGMAYEKFTDKNKIHVDSDRHWWVQAETIVGFFNLWQHFGSQKGLENALMCWDFIKSNLIDKENGEWFWSIYADGSINRNDDKAGFWKCPYHNGRMCLEILERISQI